MNYADANAGWMKEKANNIRGLWLIHEMKKMSKGCGWEEC